MISRFRHRISVLVTSLMLTGLPTFALAGWRVDIDHPTANETFSYAQILSVQGRAYHDVDNLPLHYVSIVLKDSNGMEVDDTESECDLVSGDFENDDLAAPSVDGGYTVLIKGYDGADILLAQNSQSISVSEM